MTLLRELEVENSQSRLVALSEPSAPKLSVLRVIVLLALLAAAVFGGWKLVVHASAPADAKSHAVPVYAPYVDVTLTPTYQFQLPSEDPVSTVYLGFIVSDPSAPCTPSWGGYYTLAQADRAIDLGSRVAELRAEGGSAMVSFGGLLNNELSVGCTSLNRVEQAYLATIRHYGITTIDFDIEGAALSDQAANVRRADAVAKLQRQLAKQHQSLRVWMTLPVSDQGLTSQGIAVVRAMLAAHVTLAGVNAMAMDFGGGQGAATNMFATVRRALYATHSQVESIWDQSGLPASSGFAWEHLGVTVMLGVNDITNEHFTIADARKLAAYSGSEGLARVSVWSLNRDSECGEAYPVVGTLSNTCSGVLQSTLEFTRIFSHLPGTRIANGQSVSTAPQDTTDLSTDDPATSPYPIWQSTAAYVAGYKVVWQGQIYQANWWSQGSAPGGADTDAAISSPWLLIGPVPAHSHAPAPVLLASVKQPAWSPTTVYQQGQKVEFEGLPYQARWYTKGNQPLDQLPGNPDSAWRPLFKAPGEPADTGLGSGQS